MGLYAIPEPESGVWVEFEGGDPSFPIWTGCFWADAAVGGLPPKAFSATRDSGSAPEWGIGSQAGDIHQTDVNTGVNAPRVRSLKASFAPFLHLKLHS